MTQRCKFDLVVVGAGPAGLALAGEAAGLGIATAVVAPSFEAPWTPTWCAFEGDLPDWVPTEQRWSEAEVRLDDRVITGLRPYVRVSTAGLQEALRARSREAVRVEGVAESRIASGLRLRDGRELRARWVVDCSGAAQVLNTGRLATAHQTAYGLDIETDGHPWDPGVAVWMDLTNLEDPPSFLYVLPTGPSRVFVEETVLAGRPALPVEALEARLHARLARLGVEVRGIHGVERCRIPLDAHPEGLAFGIAGGMVHPASGYLLPRVLAAAGPFAAALPGGGSMGVVRGMFGGTTRSLHLLGLDVLVGCDGPALAAFFDRFFALPPPSREAFLAMRPATTPTAAAMLRMFLGASWPLKKALAAPLFRFSPPAPEAPCPR